MSSINFVKPTGKHFSRDEIRDKRKRILEEAEADHYRRKKEKFKKDLKTDSKWMLPSLEERLKEETKQTKKKSKKQRKKRRDSSTSDSDSEEWVEKKKEITEKMERDEWMNLENITSCIGKDNEQDRKEKKKSKTEPSQCIIEKPGQSSRELNPYWKDGGTGLPKEHKDEIRLSNSKFGDGGLEWMKKSLKRSKEIAEEKGISLEEVVRERWGSLHKLESLMAEAEDEKRKQKHNQGRNSDKYSYGYRDVSKYKGTDSRSKSERYDSRSEPIRHDSRSEPNRHDSRSDSRRHDSRSESVRHGSKYESYRQESRPESSRACNSILKFQKPKDDFNESERTHSSSQRKLGGWRKKEYREEKEVGLKKEVQQKKEMSSDESSSEEEVKVEKEKPTQLLTDGELNALAAKLVKAEILGDKSLVFELQTKLDKARQDRKDAQDKIGTSSEATRQDEIVVLTRTDSKGFSRPVESVNHKEPLQGRRKKEKVETHDRGERVRYFADDDKHSLSEMFQKEKMNSTEDENLEFLNMLAKSKKSNDPDYDDDSMTEKLRYKTSDSKKYDRERNAAIKEHKTKEKSLDGCERCLDNKKQTKHLIVSIGTKSYLCLPSESSLTEGHCQIVPVHHTVASTQLDEDVWEEIQTFRKRLTDMFLAVDKDVVFFESSRNLRKFPHMVINCVPMEKEVGDMAPIYFKKAILDCETEWSTNKKLIDLSKKGLRKSVPKGLPYFCVDFGKENGFAHVIEDEKLFPHNFAQEIIAGMLDLDHTKWRKVKKDNFDTQRDKVFKFAKLWKKFDFTGRARSSSSSSSE